MYLPSTSRETKIQVYGSKIFSKSQLQPEEALRKKIEQNLLKDIRADIGVSCIVTSLRQDFCIATLFGLRSDT